MYKILNLLLGDDFGFGETRTDFADGQGMSVVVNRDSE